MPNVARFLIFIFSLYITGDVEASTKSNPTIGQFSLKKINAER